MVLIAGEENRVGEIERRKKWEKKFQFLSGELPCLLILGLGDNQVLLFCFPKDTASRLQNNKPYAHTPFHAYTDAPIHLNGVYCVVYFHTFIHTKIPGGVSEKGQSTCVCIYCV